MLDRPPTMCDCRPDDFEIDWSHPFARGLLSAWLGQGGQAEWIDSVFPGRASWIYNRWTGAIANIADRKRSIADYGCQGLLITKNRDTSHSYNGDYLLFRGQSDRFVMPSGGWSFLVRGNLANFGTTWNNYWWYEGISSQGYGGCGLMPSGRPFVKWYNTNVFFPSEGQIAHTGLFAQAFTYISNRVRWFEDGILHYDVAHGTLAVNATVLQMFQYADYSARGPAGTFADMMWWSRELSLAEICELQDPSNYLLSGLIVPRQAFFPTATAPSMPLPLFGSAA